MSIIKAEVFILWSNFVFSDQKNKVEPKSRKVTYKHSFAGGGGGGGGGGVLAAMDGV